MAAAAEAAPTAAPTLVFSGIVLVKETTSQNERQGQCCVLVVGLTDLGGTWGVGAVGRGGSAGVVGEPGDLVSARKGNDNGMRALTNSERKRRRRSWCVTEVERRPQRCVQ